MEGLLQQRTIRCFKCKKDIEGKTYNRYGQISVNAKVLDPQKLHPACESLLTPEEKQMWDSLQKKPKKS